MKNKKRKISSKIQKDTLFSSLNNTRDSIFVPELGLFYQRIPKAAGTKISYIIISYLFNDPKCQIIGNANIHYAIAILIPKLTDYDEKYIDKTLQSDSLFKFSFVRNPYTRLVSCYKDKFYRLSEIRKTIKNKKNIADILEKKSHFYEEPKYISYNLKICSRSYKNCYLPYTSKFEPVSFYDFVKYICTQKTEEMDHHWQPQTFTMNHNKILYDFIGKQENFQQDMTYVLDRLKAPLFLYENLTTKINPTDKNNSMKDYYSPEIQELVYKKFKKDFEVFGYSNELPKQY